MGDQVNVDDYAEVRGWNSYWDGRKGYVVSTPWQKWPERLHELDTAFTNENLDDFVFIDFEASLGCHGFFPEHVWHADKNKSSDQSSPLSETTIIVKVEEHHSALVRFNLPGVDDD